MACFYSVEQVLFVGGFVMEFLYFRWYNLVAAAVGVACLYLGYAGYSQKNLRYLFWFTVGQAVGLLIVFCGAMMTYYAIGYYDTDCEALKAQVCMCV